MHASATEERLSQSMSQRSKANVAMETVIKPPFHYLSGFIN